MGGPGSGRWRWHRRATTVEQCRQLELERLVRAGAFDGRPAGTIRWYWCGMETGGATYQVTPAASGGLLLSLAYSCGGQAVRMAVPVQATRTPRGKPRWWGRCPLAVGGRPGGRRLLKLYLPARSLSFGCRACHRLTYGSTQQRRTRAAFLRKNPEALRAFVDGPELSSWNDLLLVLQTLAPLCTPYRNTHVGTPAGGG